MNNVHFCECSIDLNNNGSRLTIHTSRNEVHMGCTFTLHQSLATNSEVDLLYSLNPILSMRFAVSLRRSADPDSGDEWQLKHFSTVDFGTPSSNARASAIQQHIEMGPLGPPNDKRQTRAL